MVGHASHRHKVSRREPGQCTAGPASHLVEAALAPPSIARGNAETSSFRGARRGGRRGISLFSSHTPPPCNPHLILLCFPLWDRVPFQESGTGKHSTRDSGHTHRAPAPSIRAPAFRTRQSHLGLGYQIPLRVLVSAYTSTAPEAGPFASPAILEFCRREGCRF